MNFTTVKVNNRSLRLSYGLCCALLLSTCAVQPPGTSDLEDISIEIAAVGDIMLGTDYPKDTLPDNDENILLPVAPYLRQADVAFGNLEGVLLDGGEPAKQCSSPNSCYLFRTPTRYAPYLREAGFDVMSLANNHARDFGEEGRESSMRALSVLGIHHSGQLGDIASWQVKGLRVALVAFAPFGNSNDMLDIPKAVEVVRALSRQHEIVMVSIHGGAEGLDVLHIPFAKEFYRGEDRGDVVQFSRAVIDAGADLVFGHGPHVPRAMELYKDRLIAYSLGNFSTHWGINVKGLRGLAPILLARVDRTGRFQQGQIISARQLRPAGPFIDPSHEAARLISELTRQDFPDTPLEISASGRISRKVRQTSEVADR